MTNNISIVWTSEQRALIADLQKQISTLQTMQGQQQQVQQGWNRVGNQASQAFRDVTAAMANLGRSAANTIKDSNTPLSIHLAKMKELRVLYRMGKIDADQFRRAQEELKRSFVKQTIKLPDLTPPESAASGLELLTGRVFGLAAAYKLLTEANRFWIESNKEAQRVAEEAASKQEEMVSRFRVQGGLTTLQGKAAKSSIYKSALHASATSEEAFSAATAMVSTGFDPRVAQGEGLVPFLKLLKGQALDPRKEVSPTEIAESFSKFLAATGQEKSGANVNKLAVAVQGLKATPMKVTDLSQLAKHASALKELGGLSPEEMLSNFAFLTNTEIPEEAGTHMREIVRQLATAGGSKKTTTQLAAMGLSPQDVDFQGENFATVLGRVKTGLGRLAPEERATALDTLVEGRNISSFTKLMNAQDEVSKYRGLMQDKAGFDRDFATISGGQNAKVTRLRTAQEMIDAADDANSREDRANFELYMKRTQRSPVVRAGAMAIYDMMDAGYGHNSHMIAAGGASVLGGGNADLLTTQYARMAEQEKELAEAKRVIEEYRREKDATRKPNGEVRRPIQVNPPGVTVNVNLPGGGQKPAAPPASGLAAE